MTSENVSTKHKYVPGTNLAQLSGIVGCISLILVIGSCVGSDWQALPAGLGGMLLAILLILGAIAQRLGELIKLARDRQ